MKKSDLRHKIFFMSYKVSDYLRGLLTTVFEAVLMGVFFLFIVFEFGQSAVFALFLLICAAVIFSATMKSVLVNVGKSLMNAESGCMGSVEKSIAGYRFLKTSKLSDYLNKSFAKAAHEWSASYALAGFLSTLPRVIFEALLVCIAMIALFGPADYSYGSGDSLLLLTALTVALFRLLRE